MKRFSMAVGAVLAFWPVTAEAADCSDRDNQCTRVVGCILGAQNELFIGEVYGVEAGLFEAVSSAGATCSGTFRRTQIGTAKVRTTCTDGRSGRATFFYYDKKTGTGRGKGRMSDGKQIVFWAGDNLMDYFKKEQAREFSELVSCGIDALENAPNS